MEDILKRGESAVHEQTTLVPPVREAIRLENNREMAFEQGLPIVPPLRERLDGEDALGVRILLCHDWRRQDGLAKDREARGDQTVGRGGVIHIFLCPFAIFNEKRSGLLRSAVSFKWVGP